MWVSSGISFEQPDGSWRKLTICVEDTDLMGYGDEFSAMTYNEKFRELMNTTDRMLIVQLVKEGHMSADVARAQLKDLPVKLSAVPNVVHDSG